MRRGILVSPRQHIRLRVAIIVALYLLLLACASTPQAGWSYTSLLQTVDGHLDDAVPEMTACFRREFGSEAELLNGRIVVRFEVAEDGLISTLEVLESELSSKAAELCVSDTIRRIYFAEWVGQTPVRLTKPFQFVAGR